MNTAAWHAFHTYKWAADCLIFTDLRGLRDISAVQCSMQKLAHVCSASEAVFLTTQDWLQEIEKARQVAVEHMCNMAAIRTVPASVKTNVLKFLAMHAFFVVDKAALGKVMLDSTFSVCCLLVSILSYSSLLSDWRGTQEPNFESA